MVESINHMRQQCENGWGRPSVVEIVGPAGAGKTTLCQALTRHYEQIQVGNFPNVKKITNIPFFMWNGLQIAPSLLHLQQKNGRPLSKREFAWMSILHGWPVILQKKRKEDQKIIILDQGPVYLMAEMKGFGSECLSDPGAERIWQAIYCQWAVSLDTIVWLDASDEILLERIRFRPKEHIVKDVPRSVALEFLSRFREVYERIIYMLASRSENLRILRFDTSQQQPDEIISQLLIDSGIEQNRL